MTSRLTVYVADRYLSRKLGVTTLLALHEVGPDEVTEPAEHLGDDMGGRRLVVLLASSVVSRHSFSLWIRIKTVKLTAAAWENYYRTVTL